MTIMKAARDFEIAVAKAGGWVAAQDIRLAHLYGVTRETAQEIRETREAAYKLLEQ